MVITYVGFVFSLIFAITSIVISFLSKKNWKGKRTTAVLKNAIDYLDREQYAALAKSNKCHSNIIDLTDKYFQVKIGAPETEWNGITLRAIIDDLKPDDGIMANIFLGDKKFLIDGDVSILPYKTFNDDDERLFKLNYDAKNIKEKDDKSNCYDLSNYDLILIRGKKSEDKDNREEDNKIIASFVFFDVENTAGAPDTIQICIENLDELINYRMDKQNDE